MSKLLDMSDGSEEGRAMPSARAASPSGLSPASGSSQSGIPIAGHTPLPWALSYGFDTREFGGGAPPAHYVAPANPEVIGIKLATPYVEGAWDDDDEARANAAFIVRACNSHYDLLEALETHPGYAADVTFAEIWRWLAKRDAALSKARGQ